MATKDVEQLRRQRDRSPRGGRGATAAGAAVLILLIAGWGVFGRGDDHSAVAAGQSLQLTGGEVRIDEVVPERMAHDMMPGMTMADHVPDGFRRTAVELTLLGRDAGLRFSPASFQLGGTGMEPVAPHRASGGADVVPAGMRSTLRLVFEHPQDAADLWLGFAGTEQRVTLDVAGEDGHHHGSGDDHGGQVDSGQVDSGHDHGAHDHGTHDHG